MSSTVDTHCHLDLDAFDDDRAEVIDRALHGGIHAMLLIGYNPERWESTATLCEQYPFMRRAVGLHPNDATRWSPEIERALVQQINGTDPIAIGEIGLDFYRSQESATMQVEAFTRQLELAQDAGLPVIIHQRAAEEETLRILEAHAPVAGVMHCFTGDQAFAQRCIDAGMFLGIGGVATFPKSTAIRDAIRTIPGDRWFLETDSPFIAPQSHRGRRNEPSYLVEIASMLSSELGTCVESLKTQTTQNAIALFGPSLDDAVWSGMEYL